MRCLRNTLSEALDKTPADIPGSGPSNSNRVQVGDRERGFNNRVFVTLDDLGKHFYFGPTINENARLSYQGQGSVEIDRDDMCQSLVIGNKRLCCDST